MVLSPFRRRVPRIGLMLAAFGVAAGIGGLARPAGATSVQAWSVARSAQSWSVATLTGPSPRSGAAVAYDADSHDVMAFGGSSPSGPLDDTWAYNGTAWTLLHPVGRIPPARSDASLAYSPTLHQLILFGGAGPNGPLDDTWAWNGSSWYQESPPSSPPARSGAALAASNPGGGLVLFGGETSTTTNAPNQSTTTSGTQSSTTTPSSPSGRSTSATSGTETSTTSSATTTANRESFLGDTWIWDGSTWIQQRIAGPSPRAGALAASDTATGSVLLVGGRGAHGELRDAWMYKSARWAPVAGPPVAAPVTSATGAYDGATNQLLLLGPAPAGISALWAWDGTTWSTEPLTGGDAPSTGASAAYDPINGKVVVVGGAGAPSGAGSWTLSAAPSPSPTTSSTSTTTPKTGSKAKTSTPSPHSTPAPTARPAHPSNAPGRPRASSTTATTTAPSTTRPASPASRAPVASPPAKPTAPLRLAPRTPVRRGATVTLHASGFAPDAVVTITFHSAPQLLTRARANDQGDLSVQVTVPADAAFGRHHLEATGAGANGQRHTVLSALRVVAYTATPGTDRHRTRTLILLGIALGLPAATWLFLNTRRGGRLHPGGPV